MGAVALLATETGPVFDMMGSGPVGTREVAAPAGVTEVVMGRGTGEVFAEAGTGEVISFGTGMPAPGRARKVMRTVSFFRGTAAVFWDGLGGVGWLLESLIGAKF